MRLAKFLLRCLLRLLYRVEVTGLENLNKASNKTLIISNHTSYLDGVLMYAWFPNTPTFAINTQVAERALFKPFLRFVELFPMDQTNPHSLKSMIRFIAKGNQAVIFPEGRITTTGSLMKIYEGPGMIADKAGAELLAVHIDGAQMSPFSCMQGNGRIIWFPRIRMHIAAPYQMEIASDLRPHERRQAASRQLKDLMMNRAYESHNTDQTLYSALIRASQRYGRKKTLLVDMNYQCLDYKTLILKSQVLSRVIARATEENEHVGILLPNVLAMPVVFFAIHACHRVPALLNFSSGARVIISMLETANVKTVYTARRFIDNAKLQPLIDVLASHCRIIYLEDLISEVTTGDKIAGLVNSLRPNRIARQHKTISAENPAAILFTSGSEGLPKGVVLSHKNILANHAQVNIFINFSYNDTVFNCLPTFHSFGLNAGLLMPIFSGSRVFLYPSPLHYRIIPELIYQSNATILFGTNTFLKGYARFAHDFDFANLRYVVAGAEKLHEDTIELYKDKFGIRILQGYGVTETSPVISVNIPLFHRAKTVGRSLAKMECAIEDIDGIENGGRLLVKGPNVMQGYLLHSNPGAIQFPEHKKGPGWYDTGDIASIDKDGYITILGRAKRFAKIGGEMISLTAVEELAMEIWPNQLHAAVNLADERKGEKIILISNDPSANRKTFQEHVREHQRGELLIPKTVLFTDEFPVLGSGKIDYTQLTELATEADTRGESWLTKLSHLVKN